jgi:hypothetical protein
MTILWIVLDFSDCKVIIDNVENLHHLILTGSLEDM